MQQLTVAASSSCSVPLVLDASPWCPSPALVVLSSAPACAVSSGKSSAASSCTAISDPGGTQDTSGQEQLRSVEVSDRSADWTDTLSAAAQSVLPSPAGQPPVRRWPLGTGSAWEKTSPASVSSSSWLEDSEGVDVLDLCGVKDSWLVRVVCSMLEAVSLWWARAGLEESSEDSEELDQTVPFSISPCRFSRDWNQWWWKKGKNHSRVGKVQKKQLFWKTWLIHSSVQWFTDAFTDSWIFWFIRAQYQPNHCCTFGCCAISTMGLWRHTTTSKVHPITAAAAAPVAIAPRSEHRSSFH